jgi:hypothetical protein
MSYKFGGLCLLKNYEQNPQTWQKMLDMPCAGGLGAVSMKAATSGIWPGIAYAYLDSCILIQANEYVMDANFYDDELYELDQLLATASTQIQIFIYWLDGMTSTYGFALFENGKRTRVRGILNGNVAMDDGEPLPAEQHFGKEDINDEVRIFTIIESLIGRSFTTLINSDFQLNTCN